MTPNLVFIIVDNESPWTLGCYGNDEILTPGVDRLAREGVRFTNAFCTNPVCSPNRATLMTGLMPSQHGVHNWLGTEKPSAQLGPDAYCTIREFTTLPRVLADAGYACGLSGKWHLGDSAHPQLGFDYWFSKPLGHTHHFYGEEAIWQGKTYNEPRYYPEAITDHAIDFLDRTRARPFFLYVGYNGPYGLDKDMLVGHRNRHTAYYADKPLRCFPREAMHPWLVEYRDRIKNETAIRSYACAVSGVDDGVVAILDALAARNLERDTIVVFTADHGLCGGHHGLWGMGDHSRPLHMFQENMRVPLIFRLPGRKSAGRIVETMTNHYDFLPSILSILGLGDRLPGRPPLPGRSYAPALVGRACEGGEEITFHEYENTRAAQTPRWKLIRRHPAGPDEFYDLKEDPGERRNRNDDPLCAEARAVLSARLDQFFRQYVDPQYDLWRNGRSKAGRILENTVASNQAV
ncbi:MAG: sulfatase-like hydrolase/transferase [Lentisphaerae bacterium]|nr:sulfatase-like hydrolase/transferase [Lentisphaerota bacterium]